MGQTAKKEDRDSRRSPTKQNTTRRRETEETTINIIIRVDEIPTVYSSVPLETYLLKASPVHIRNVCVCVCVRLHSETPESLCILFRSIEASKGLPSGYSKSVCLYVCVDLHPESSEPTMLISQTTPNEHPSTLLPSRWPAFITLPALAKFQLVWRRLCDAVLFRSSCLFEHTLTSVCALPDYQYCRKYNEYPKIL